MKSRIPARLSLAAIALGLVLPLIGCLVSASSTTAVTGKRITEATLGQIGPGADRNLVLAILTEPTSRSPLEDGGEIWKWTYREETTSKGGVFLLISSRRKTEKTGNVYVMFQNDVVTKTWRD